MIFTWINNRAGWHFVFTFSPFSTVRVRLCLRWTASKLSFWIILVFCDKPGRLYLWSLFKAIQYNSQILHILTRTEDMTHRYCISSRVLRICLTGTAHPHGYWGYDSRVLHILTGTEDMTHRYWGYDSWVLHIFMGTEDITHGYWGYDSRVLRIWLMGTSYPHGYWWYDSWVLMIWLTGNAYPHGYCIPSWVLHIVYTFRWILRILCSCH